MNRMAKPLRSIERRSPPLPLIAMTRDVLPVRGALTSSFELVLPPPKFVMRRSAPSRLERYRRSSSASAESAVASRSSHRFSRYLVAGLTLSGKGQLHVLSDARVLGVPSFEVLRLESLDGKRALDDPPRASERRNGVGRHHRHRDVPEGGRFDGPGRDGTAGRVRRELVQQSVARSA